jgi:hypothetical protein
MTCASERIMNDVRVQAGYSYRQIVDQVRLLAEVGWAMG